MNINLKKIKSLSEKKSTRTSNRFLYTFMAIFVLGYVVFFTSKLWLPKTYEGVNITPIGSVLTENDRIITLDSWTFSPEQKLMEIIIEIDSYALDEIKTYKFRVRDVNGFLKTNLVKEDGTFFVINVNNVDKNWTEVALTIDAPEDSKINFSQVKIYSNDKSVKTVSKISKDENINYYKKIAFTSKIEKFSNDKKEKEDKITELEDSITIADSKILEFTEKLEYQTESEKSSLKTKIDKLEGTKKEMQEQIMELKVEIEEITKKIEKQNKLLEALD